MTPPHREAIETTLEQAARQCEDKTLDKGLFSAEFTDGCNQTVKLVAAAIRSLRLGGELVGKS